MSELVLGICFSINRKLGIQICMYLARDEWCLFRCAHPFWSYIELSIQCREYTPIQNVPPELPWSSELTRFYPITFSIITPY